jgi:hypothetical protein
MFNPLVVLLATTQSMAAMIWLTSAAPMASATLTETIRASGAMPRKLAVSPGYLPATAASARPAMIPAMWVPCP